MYVRTHARPCVYSLVGTLFNPRIQNTVCYLLGKTLVSAFSMSSSSCVFHPMDVEYDGQTAFDAAANGDFPLVVLLWGMAMAVQPEPIDLLAAKDQYGNSLVHYAAAAGDDTCETMHFVLQQLQARGRPFALLDARNDAGETPLMCVRVGQCHDRVFERL